MLAWIFSSQCSLRLLGGPGLVPGTKRGSTSYFKLVLLACLAAPLMVWVRDRFDEGEWVNGISETVKSLESSGVKAFRGLRCDSKVTNSDLDQLKIWAKIRQFLSDKSVSERTSKCDNYFEQMLQFSAHATLEQFMGETGKADEDPNSNFTIAFSHAVHHHVGIFELFLALYFRPKNLHCIHVDIKVGMSMCILHLLSIPRSHYLLDCFASRGQ